MTERSPEKVRPDIPSETLAARTPAASRARRDWPYRVHLAPEREKSVLRRHPWIFSGAIGSLEALDSARPGDLGLVLEAGGRRLGVAYVNPEIRLTARMLRWDDGPVDRDWFAARMAAALALRARVVPADVTALRLINAEGDGLPGLIVDRYGEVLVVQCQALGMSRLEPLWLTELVAQAAPRSVVARSAHGRGECGSGVRMTEQSGQRQPVQRVAPRGA